MARGRIPATGQIVNTNNHKERSHLKKYLYVNKIGDDGWLRTQFSVSVHSPLGARASRPLKWRPRWPRSQEKAGGSERLQFSDHPINYTYLCKYTKLQALPSNNRRPTENRRSYFKVMDGPQYGKVVSLNEINAGIYIGSYAPTSSPINVAVTYGKYVKDWVSEARGGEKINQQMATLNIGNITAQVTMNSNWGFGYYPLPPGEYKILIPDAPHPAKYTEYYRKSEPSLKVSVHSPLGARTSRPLK